MRRLLAILWLVTCLSDLASASDATGGLHPSDVELARTAEAWLTRQFTIYRSLPLDPALRSAGQSLASEHLARVRPLLHARIVEERAIVGPPRAERDIQWRVMAWLANEVALYRLPSDNDDEREIDRSLLARPMLCRVLGTASPFAEQLLRVQQLPAEQWPAALAIERRRLDQWGQPRPNLPVRPGTADDRRLAAAIAAAKQGEATRVPMPPILARNVVEHDWPFVSPVLRCVARQWWARSQLGADPQEEAAARLAYAFWTTPEASQLFALSPIDTARQAADPGGYPLLAAQFDVAARITVELTFDFAGKVIGTEIVGRDVVVAGVRGVRPVAFETLFDAASLMRARMRSRPASEPTRPTDRRRVERIELVWSLK